MLTVLTNHAKQRCEERNISHDEIEFIVKHTKPIHRAGVAFYQYQARNVPNDSSNDRYVKLVGTTVVACKNCKVYIFTVYRNPKAFKADNKKQKYNIKKQPQYCPCCDNMNVA